MIDLPTARALVEQELAKQSLHQAPENQLVIVDVLSIEELGWVFSYGSSAFLVTHSLDDAFTENLLIIVDKKDGALRHTSASRPTQTKITGSISHEKTWCVDGLL